MTMTWNYRVLAPVNDKDVFSLVEVYYEDGEIVAWSDAHPPQSDDHDDLIGSLQMMYLAAAKSRLKQDGSRLLTHDDLPSFDPADGVA